MPEGHPDPQVVPYLLYADAGAAMDWLIRAFAFTEVPGDTALREAIEEAGYELAG